MGTLTDEQKEELIALQATRIRDLEIVLGLHDDKLGVTFKLTPGQNRLLGLLLATPYVTGEMVRQRLEITTHVNVAMLRLRRALKPWSAEIGEDPIQSKRSMGWWLERKTKEAIRAIVTPKVTFPPAETPDTKHEEQEERLEVRAA